MLPVLRLTAVGLLLAVTCLVAAAQSAPTNPIVGTVTTTTIPLTWTNTDGNAIRVYIKQLAASGLSTSGTFSLNQTTAAAATSATVTGLTQAEAYVFKLCSWTGAVETCGPQSSWFSGTTDFSGTRNNFNITRDVIAEPTLKALPLKGGYVWDTTFGVKFLRVTDDTTPGGQSGVASYDGCGTFYNQWPTLNSGNTRLFMRCSDFGDVNLYNFNPATFTLGSLIRTSPNLTGGVSIQWQGATWDKDDPAIIYVWPNSYDVDYPASGPKLYSYDASTTSTTAGAGTTLVNDFTTDGVPATRHFFEGHVAQDDIFTFGEFQGGSLTIASSPTGATESGTTVTITTTTNHNYMAGNMVAVAGVGVSGYNGSFTITGTPSATTFTYTAGSSGLAASGSGTVTAENPLNYTIYKRSTDTILLRIATADSRLFAPGTNVALPDKSGRYVFFSTNGGGVGPFTIANSPTGATQSGTTVTITISGTHSLAVGSPIIISGVGVSGYNGSFFITSVPTSSSFTYTTTAGLSSSGSGLASVRRIAIWDSQTDTWQYIPWNPTGDGASHGDMGTELLLGRGNFSGDEIIRSNLANVTAVTTLFDWKVPITLGVRDWSEDCHSSLYADNETWGLLGCYDFSDVGETGVWENEMMQINTLVPNLMRRLFHHRSRVLNTTGANGYWAIPKPTISKDGRFITFTSNWEDSGRYDLFVAEIPQTLSGPATFRGPIQVRGRVTVQP